MQQHLVICARKRNIIGEGKMYRTEGILEEGITRIGDRSCRYYLTRTCNDCAPLHVRNRITERIPSVGISSSWENKSIGTTRQSWRKRDSIKLSGLFCHFDLRFVVFYESAIAFPTLLNFIYLGRKKNERERGRGLRKLMVRSASSWIWYLLNYISLLARLTAQSYINFALQVICNS